MRREAVMRRVWAMLPLAGALLAGCSGPKTAPAAQVDEVVARNLAARGGEARLRALKSLRESGTVTASDGRVARVVREIRRPGLYRLEFSFQGTKSVFANDGVRGWQVAPLQGQFEPRAVPPEADAAGGLDQRDIEGPLVDWRGKGHLVELVGRETLPTGEADRLKVTLAGGAVRWDDVDVASGQIVRSEVTRTVRGRATVLESTFSEFREVGGLVFPHVIETRARNRPRTTRIVIESIEIDPELDEARFRLPNGGSGT